MINQRQQLVAFLIKMRNKQDFKSEESFYFQNRINYITHSEQEKESLIKIRNKYQMFSNKWSEFNNKINNLDKKK